MQNPVPIIVLAGGQALRLGKIDKALVKLDAQTTLMDLILRTAKTVSPILAINSNKDPASYEAYDCPVFADLKPNLGPLGGIASAMAWAKTHHPQVTAILSLAGDTPFVPSPFLQSLMDRHDKEPSKLLIAHDGIRAQPTIGLWPMALQEPLQMALRQNVRKIMGFVQTCEHELVACAPLRSRDISIDPFMNINQPKDITQAQEIYRQLKLMT